MIYNFLKSKNLTIVLFIIILPLMIIEAKTRDISGYIFIGVAVPLAVNLLFCLYEHIGRIQKLTLEKTGFIAFHAALLIILAGGIVTFLTYRMGYIEVAEGHGFTDEPENYTGWKQKFGTSKGSGIAIYVKKIVLEFWENGQVKEFYNEILIQDGDRVIEERIDVNGSVKYGDLLINMARFYGLAPYFTLKTSDGDISGYVTIQKKKNEPPIPVHEFEIPVLGYTAFAKYNSITDKEIDISILGPKKSIIKRAMKAGDVIKLEENRLELTRIDVWNGLTVVNDSGKGITYTGFILFLTGLALFYGRKFFREDTT